MLRQFRSTGHHMKAIWWTLTIVTVVTFLGGFVFIFGAGFDFGGGGRSSSGSLGSVDGEPITAQEYQNALQSQRDAFRRQYGSDPADRDEKSTEAQAWRGLVTQKIMDEQARKVGLKATDDEIVLAMKTSPPQELLNLPAFQTDGKFDPRKYQAALNDPNNTFWGVYEELVRQQLPSRKLQERLLSSIKLSQPELIQAYHDRFDRVAATIVMVAPDLQGKATPPTPADIERAYQEYKGRLNSGPRVDLEILMIPKKYGDEDVRAARQFAQTLVDRARRGDDFAQLAKDYSEGPAASTGGEINRPVQPAELGPELGKVVGALQPGQVSDPIAAEGRFVIFKLIDRVANPVAPEPALRLAQIVVRVRPSEGAVSSQYAELQKLRSRAMALKSLGTAATERGLQTARTGYFDMGSLPPVLASVPEAADWAFGAKLRQVSPIIEGTDGYLIAQVAQRHPGGPIPRDQLGETLRQIAEMDQRVNAVKPAADRIAQAVAQGQTLENAAKAAGQTPFAIADLTRATPDPRLGMAPDLIGRLFAARPGQTVGPVREPAGWFVARLDQKAEAPMDSTFMKIQGQLRTQILEQRQRSFFNGWLADLRMKAKIQDNRFGGGPSAQ